MTESIKLAIVGLDGASPNIYNQFVEEIPTLSRTIEQGSSGTLHSTTPPITGPAWTTMMTGKNPGSHGVFDMATPDKNYDVQPLQANRDQPALYDYIDDSLMINVPGSYPRRPAGKAMLVHSFDCPSSAIAIPEELADLPAAEDYLLSNPKSEYSKEVPYMKRLREIESRRFDFLQQSLDQVGSVEILFVLFSSTDWALHFLTDLSTPGGKELKRLYADIDSYTNWIEQRAENLLIMSDHGFERKQLRVNNARFLESNGYMRFENNVGEESQPIPKKALGLLTSGVSAASQRSVIIQRVIQWAIKNIASDEFVAEARDSWSIETDWERTEAFPTGYQGIYLNRKGKFRNGFVDSKQAEEIQTSIINKLKLLTDKYGNDVFKHVLRREDVYHGAYVMEAPDIICIPKSHVVCHSVPNANDRIINDIQIFDHRKDGMYAGIGPMFSQGANADFDIADIAPTVLHILGRPIPSTMDGQPMSAAIDTDHEVEFTEKETAVGPFGDAPSDHESDKVKERLQDLGYI